MTKPFPQEIFDSTVGTRRVCGGMHWRLSGGIGESYTNDSLPSIGNIQGTFHPTIGKYETVVE